MKLQQTGPPVPVTSVAPRGPSPSPAGAADFAALLPKTMARTALAEGQIPISTAMVAVADSDGAVDGENVADEAVSAAQHLSAEQAAFVVPTAAVQLPVPAGESEHAVSLATTAIAGAEREQTAASPTFAFTAATAERAIEAADSTLPATLADDLPDYKTSTPAANTAAVNRLIAPTETQTTAASEIQPPLKSAEVTPTKIGESLLRAVQRDGSSTAQDGISPLSAAVEAMHTGGASTVAAQPTAAPSRSTPAVADPQPQPQGQGVQVGQIAQAPGTATPFGSLAPSSSQDATQATLSRGSVASCAQRIVDLVNVATLRDGRARATMQLRPAELGRVDVVLRTTSSGLVATLQSHEQAGHVALQQAGAELQRTLESRGVTIARLDLRFVADEGLDGHQRQDRGGGAQGSDSDRPDRSGATAIGVTARTTFGDDPLVAAPTTTLPDGVLVDVRA